jgi:LPXTG-motif cell wall-anchored protein
MKSSQSILKSSYRLVVVGMVFLISTVILNAQVETETQVQSGKTTRTQKVDRGEVVYVSGNDLIVKTDDGQLRHFSNVPDSLTVNVDGKQLNVHQLKPGMKLERTTITSTTPRVVTTTETVTGRVFHVSPPNSVILTLDNGKNESFNIPNGQKFTVNGQQTDAFGLRKGMTISATKVTETPETLVTQQVTRTGQMPPPPQPPPQETPILVVAVGEVAQVNPPAPPPQQEVASLPKTGSTVPLIGLLGLVCLGAAFGMQILRRQS